MQVAEIVVVGGALGLSPMPGRTGDYAGDLAVVLGWRPSLVLTLAETGELAKALEILKAGGDIDYVGATAVELIGPGESSGSYREFEMKGGKIETVRFR